MLTNGPYGPINTAILLDTYMKAYDNACGMIVNMQQIIEQIRDGKGDALKIDDNVLKLLSGEKELSEVTLPEGANKLKLDENILKLLAGEKELSQITLPESIFKVTITSNDTNGYKADKNYSEIIKAIEDGNFVFAHNSKNDRFYMLTGLESVMSSYGVRFACISNNNRCYYINIWDYGSVEVGQTQIIPVEDEVYYFSSNPVSGIAIAKALDKKANVSDVVCKITVTGNDTDGYKADKTHAQVLSIYQKGILPYAIYDDTLFIMTRPGGDGISFEFTFHDSGANLDTIISLRPNSSIGVTTSPMVNILQYVQVLGLVQSDDTYFLISPDSQDAPITFTNVKDMCDQKILCYVSNTVDDGYYLYAYGTDTEICFMSAVPDKSNNITTVIINSNNEITVTKKSA